MEVVILLPDEIEREIPISLVTLTFIDQFPPVTIENCPTTVLFPICVMEPLAQAPEIVTCYFCSNLYVLITEYKVSTYG